MAGGGVGFGGEVFVMHDLHALRVVQQGLVFADRHFKLGGDLGFRGRAHQALFKLLDGLFDLARLGAHAARQPVLAA
ncbi:hypothetical protein D3C87_2101690 [compost metagenome]